MMKFYSSFNLMKDFRRMLSLCAGSFQIVTQFSQVLEVQGIFFFFGGASVQMRAGKEKEQNISHLMP